MKEFIDKYIYSYTLQYNLNNLSFTIYQWKDKIVDERFNSVYTKNNHCVPIFIINKNEIYRNVVTDDYQDEQYVRLSKYFTFDKNDDISDMIQISQNKIQLEYLNILNQKKNNIEQVIEKLKKSMESDKIDE